MAVKMPDFIRVVVKWSGNDHELDIRRKRQVSQLKSCIREVYGWEGNLYFRQNNIDYKKKTFGELQMKNNDVINLKHGKKLKKTTLVNVVIFSNSVQVPVNCTVESLKFFIECKEKIIMEHQCFEYRSTRLDSDPNHRLTKEELEGLVITDLTRKVSSPVAGGDYEEPPYQPPNDVVMSFNKLCGDDSPKVEEKLPTNAREIYQNIPKDPTDKQVGGDYTEPSYQPPKVEEKMPSPTINAKEKYQGILKDQIIYSKAEAPTATEMIPECEDREDKSSFVFQGKKESPTMPTLVKHNMQPPATATEK